jgi:hypothetical protein
MEGCDMTPEHSPHTPRAPSLRAWSAARLHATNALVTEYQLRQAVVREEVLLSAECRGRLAIGNRGQPRATIQRVHQRLHSFDGEPASIDQHRRARHFHRKEVVRYFQMVPSTGPPNESRSRGFEV